MLTETVPTDLPVQLAEDATSLARYSPLARQTIATLEQRLGAVFAEVQQHEMWRTVTAPHTPVEVVRAIVREVMLSVCWYQGHTTEAGFHMIGRLPKSEQAMLKLLMLHKVEEAEHGGWALRDYLALGGSEETARQARISPDTFAVTAVWWRMATIENPFGYLGAEYLFEYLTMLVGAPLVRTFRSRGFDASGFRFIIEHATEDLKHSILIRSLIGDAVTRYPDSAPAMLACFDYFRAVYPMPVWSAAYRRAVGLGQS